MLTILNSNHPYFTDNKNLSAQNLVNALHLFFIYYSFIQSQTNLINEFKILNLSLIKSNLQMASQNIRMFY